MYTYNVYTWKKAIGQRLLKRRRTQNKLSLKENGENTESLQV